MAGNGDVLAAEILEGLESFLVAAGEQLEGLFPDLEKDGVVFLFLGANILTDRPGGRGSPALCFVEFRNNCGGGERITI